MTSPLPLATGRTSTHKDMFELVKTSHVLTCILSECDLVLHVYVRQPGFNLRVVGAYSAKLLFYEDRVDFKFFLQLCGGGTTRKNRMCLSGATRSDTRAHREAIAALALSNTAPHGRFPSR